MVIVWTDLLKSHESPFGTQRDEMHLQGDFPLEPALTVVMKSAGVRLEVQQNQSKRKLLSVKLWKILARAT